MMKRRRIDDKHAGLKGFRISSRKHRAEKSFPLLWQITEDRQRTEILLLLQRGNRIHEPLHFRIARQVSQPIGSGGFASGFLGSTVHGIPPVLSIIRAV